MTGTVAPRRPMVPLAAMSAAILVAATLPVLFTRRFYLAGDSIASWLPTNRRIGELLLNGDSTLMDVGAWRSGNYVAEAGYGLWNPVILFIDVTILQIDDLELAAALTKALFMLALGVGTYLLARAYGAQPWPAALVGLAAPISGFTLYMDAATWSPNLISFAFIPYVWLAAKRVAPGTASPLWLAVSGALAVTAGNPYSNVVVFVIVVAVAIEVEPPRSLRRLVGLASGLAATGLVAIFVYIPFRQTSSVGFRRSVLENTEVLSPGVGDFLGASTPTYIPFIKVFGVDSLQFPGIYLAWFVIPLAPWLRWRTLQSRGREIAGIGVFGLFFFAMALGPSEFWFFRWPIRLVPFAYLAVLLALAVVLSAGIETSRPRQRWMISIATIALPTYIAWANVPGDLMWAIGGALLVFGGVAITVRLADVPARRGAAMLVVSLLVLVFQLQWAPSNASVRDYRTPESASAIEAVSEGRYVGNVVQIRSFDKIPVADRSADAAYGDLTISSTFMIAGMESVSGYSGVGFSTHDSALCVAFDGSMCAGAWDRMWEVPDGSTETLADLIQAETIVVHRELRETADVPAPAGWEQAEVTEHAVVWRRTAALAWPDGRVSAVNGPTTVIADTIRGPHSETVTLRDSERSGDVIVTFARLAWPGYVAEMEGAPLLVGGGPAGLLTVTVPADVVGDTITLSWTPPFWRPSLLALALGVLVAIASHVWWLLTRRAQSGQSA